MERKNRWTGKINNNESKEGRKGWRKGNEGKEERRRVGEVGRERGKEENGRELTFRKRERRKLKEGRKDKKNKVRKDTRKRKQTETKKKNK